MTTFKQVPQVPIFDDPAVTDFCVAIKQRLEVYQGNIGSGSDVVLRKELLDLTKLDEADLNTIGEYGEDHNWGTGVLDNFKIGTQDLGGILWDAITVSGVEKHNFTLFDLTNNEPWISAYHNKGVLQYYNGGLRLETTFFGVKTTGDAEITGEAKISGQMTIAGGSPGIDKVLTCINNNGLASWQELDSGLWTDGGEYIYPNNGSDYCIIDSGIDLTAFTFEDATTYVLSPGIYEVNTSVILSNNHIVLLCEGAAIKKMATADGIRITGNNCQVRGLEVDGNSQDWSGIAVYGSNNIVKDILSHNNNGHGIMQDGQSTACIYNQITNCMSYSNGNIGISLNDAQFNIIADNIIYSNGNEGITLDSTGSGWAAGNTVTGNMLYDNAISGIAGIGMDKARCNTVTGNYVDNNNRAYSGLKTHNNIDVCYNNIISGNTFINSARYGIEIAAGAGGASHDNKICGNVYLNNTLGDYFICPTCTNNVVIEGGSSIKPYRLVVDAAGSGDFATITAALAALGTSSGEIKIREGTYGAGESFPLVLYPYQSLVGSGMESTFITPQSLSSGSVVQLTPTSIGGVLTIPSIRVSDLSVDGKNTTGTVSGIYEPTTTQDLYCRAGTNLYQGSCGAGYGPDGTRRILENIRIWNMSGRGVELKGEGNFAFNTVEVAQCRRTGIYLTPFNCHGTMHSCISEFNGRSNVSGDNYGIHLDNAQAVMMTNCFSVLNQGHNLYAKATTPGSSDQLTIDGCIVEDSIAGDGINIDGYYNSRIVHNFVSNNTIASNAAIRVADMHRSVISENNIAYSAYDGIHVTDCSNSVIAGNIIDDAVVTHYSLYVTGGTKMSIFGNITTDFNWGTYPTNSVRLHEEIAAGYGFSMNVVGSPASVFESYHFKTSDITRQSDSKNVQWDSGGGLNNIVEDVTPQLGGNLDLNGKTITGTGIIDLPDGDCLKIGNSDDMRLRNDGTYNRIDLYGSNSFLLYDMANSDDIIRYNRNADLIMYYNGLQKLRTASGGIVVTGSCTGCDYVFEPGYDLVSFNELQSFINKNECLPNMTTNKGTEIDINKFRQESIEKIEELTLYILQLHGRLQAIETQPRGN